MKRLLALGPYREMLGRNPDFRRLWCGQVVSQMGDWFSSIAVYSLLLERTGRGQSVAYALIAQLLPLFLLGPPAGVVADRLDRKRILIVTDLMRAAVVALFILAEAIPGTAQIYALLVLQVSLSAFFEPAKSALLPSVTRREDWLTANTLSGMTWSVMLALGAGLGGGVAALLGRRAAFGIDALTFLASARILSGIARRPAMRAAGRGAAAPASEFLDGLRYLARHRGVAGILIVKSAWGLGGGVLLLYSIFGARVFPVGKGAAASIGLLYAARGLGAAIGPILGRAYLGESPPQLRRKIAIAFALAGLCFVGFARAPTLPLALLGVFGSHIGGSMLWIFSTMLLQISTPDRFRGRIFAVEMAGVTLTMSISNFVTGGLLDRAGLSPRVLGTILGLYFLLPAVAWWLLQRKASGAFDAAIASASEGGGGEGSPLADTIRPMGD